jgi:hypothetical protein
LLDEPLGVPFGLLQEREVRLGMPDGRFDQEVDERVVSVASAWLAGEESSCRWA